MSGDTKGVESNSICSISWNPLSNGEMIFCDNSGQLGLIDGIYEKTIASTSVPAASNLDDDLDIYNDDCKYAIINYT